MKFALLPPILLGSVFCVNSWAGDVPARPWDKRFALYGGGINYSMDGTFSSSKDDRPDIDVDMDDLGLDEDKLTYFLGAALRVGGSVSIISAITIRRLRRLIRNLSLMVRFNPLGRSSIVNCLLTSR